VGQRRHLKKELERGHENGDEVSKHDEERDGDGLQGEREGAGVA
jgi:hypothetical protein